MCGIHRFFFHAAVCTAGHVHQKVYSPHQVALVWYSNAPQRMVPQKHLLPFFTQDATHQDVDIPGGGPAELLLRGAFKGFVPIWSGSWAIGGVAGL